MHKTQHYSPLEEKTNIWSHILGLGLSIVGLGLLLLKSMAFGDPWHIAASTIFGLSLVCLYAASATYHSATDLRKRARRRIFDHAAIYVLIAGTYTPFTLITLKGWVGWTIFAVSWGMAVTGVILKLFYTGRFILLSTLMYVFMGWMIIFAVKPLSVNLAAGGMFWLIAGGVAYTVGAILYSIRKIPFNHAIFHLFVLLGSFCHFLSVYLYILPSQIAVH
jgi:hemolysin III